MIETTSLTTGHVDVRFIYPDYPQPNNNLSRFHYNFTKFVIPRYSNFMNNKQKLNEIEMKKKIYWKKEYISELKRLSNKYLTDSQIAKELSDKFNDRFTADSIKRKRHRSNLIKYGDKIISKNSFHIRLNKRKKTKGFDPFYFPIKLIEKYSIDNGDYILLSICDQVFISRIKRKKRYDRKKDNFTFYIPYQLLPNKKIETTSYLRKLSNTGKEPLIINDSINLMSLLKNNLNIVVGPHVAQKDKILLNAKRASIPIGLPKYIPITKELIQCLGFFQGEGSKTASRRIEVVNSDPNLIRLFTKTIETSFGLDNLNWKVCLKYTSQFRNLNIEKQYTDYWSKEINIPKNRFTKSQFYKGNADAENGSVQIYLSNLALRELWIKLLNFSHNLIKQSNKYAKWFLQGVLAADGCPVFSHEKLISVLIRIENEKEGQIYMNALRKLKIKAKFYPHNKQIVIGRIFEMKKVYDFQLFVLHQTRHKKFINGIKIRGLK